MKQTKKRKNIVATKKKSSSSVNWSTKKVDWRLALVVILVAVVGTWLLASSNASPTTYYTSGGSSGTTSSGTGSSIKIDQTSPYFGGAVTFTTTYPKLKANITPRIAVWCFQDVNGDGVVTTTRSVSNGDYVYAEAGSADQAFQKNLTGYSGFVLGGSSSIWIQRGGGAATCNAELFYYSYSGKQQIYNYLAETPNWAVSAAQ